MGDLGARVGARKQPLCALERLEHHIDGDIPVGVAVDLDAGPVHPLDPGVEIVLLVVRLPWYGGSTPA